MPQAYYHVSRIRKTRAGTLWRINYKHNRAVNVLFDRGMYGLHIGTNLYAFDGVATKRIEQAIRDHEIELSEERRLG